MSEEPVPRLQMTGISKHFPGVQALSDVDLTVYGGECLALVGENGAGKSTLMKILSGVYLSDAGTMQLDGVEFSPHNPHHSQQLGISIIYQEFNLFPNLTVEENIFIGREPNSAGFVHRRELRQHAEALLARLRVNLDPRTVVRTLSVAEQQMVEIAKALSYNARIVIMDEPTSALTETEVSALFSIIKDLQADGLGVIFISHRLEEVFEISDRVTVLRDGRNAGDVVTADSTPEEVVQLMVGRSISELFVKESSTATEEIALEVRGLSRTGTKQDASKVVLNDISLNVKKGEIVGLAGLVGSGRTELARAIFGADRIDQGAVFVNGEPVKINNPPQAIAHGIALVPEDRKLQALFLELAVRPNISLPSLGDISTAGFVRPGEERTLANYFVDALQIRTPSIEQKVVNLSGGNQQKVVLSKWLALKPTILLVDEPTRGIDIGAKAEVHELLVQLAAEGVAILMISSELPEILRMSDRILVMREGQIAGEMPREEATQQGIMELATGVSATASAA